MNDLTFDFSFLFPELRPANEGREDERRCLATRKDGSPCRPWAVWNASKQLCAVHLHPKRRKRREMTPVIRKEQARRSSPSETVATVNLARTPRRRAFFQTR